MPVKTKTIKKQLSLDENIKHLRQILSVDTVLEDINQEEALEFLDAVKDGIAVERQETKDALEETEDELKALEKSKDEEITGLKDDYDELMKKTDFDMQIGTIEYRSPGIMDDLIMDDLIMEALSEVYDRLTPLEIIDRLKLTKLKTA